eukprot:UN08605
MKIEEVESSDDDEDSVVLQFHSKAMQKLADMPEERFVRRVSGESMGVLTNQSSNCDVTEIIEPPLDVSKSLATFDAESEITDADSQIASALNRVEEMTGGFHRDDLSSIDDPPVLFFIS